VIGKTQKDKIVSVSELLNVRISLSIHVKKKTKKTNPNLQGEDQGLSCGETEEPLSWADRRR